MLTDEELEQLLKMYLSSKGYNTNTLNPLGDNNLFGSKSVNPYSNMTLENKLGELKNSNLRILKDNEKPKIENPSEKIKYIVIPINNKSLENRTDLNGTPVNANYNLDGLLNFNPLGNQGKSNYKGNNVEALSQVYGKLLSQGLMDGYGKGNNTEALGQVYGKLLSQGLMDGYGKGNNTGYTGRVNNNSNYLGSTLNGYNGGKNAPSVYIGSIYINAKPGASNYGVKGGNYSAKGISAGK
jgi:hypothetical protein